LTKRLKKTILYSREANKTKEVVEMAIAKTDMEKRLTAKVAELRRLLRLDSELQ